MTAPQMPPWKPSHWVRNASIGIVVIMVLLAAVGSAAYRPKNEAPAEPSAGPADSAASGADLPEDSPSPLPSGATLLSVKGSGPMISEPFNGSGSSVDVTYEFTCGASDSFTLSFFGTNESPLLPDILVSSDSGSSDSSTTTENLNGLTGPFHLEIDSTCTWSVTVIGAP